MSSSSMAIAGMGERYVGRSLSGVHPKTQGMVIGYLSHFGEHMRCGHGLAFTGPQGTGKTTLLALMAEAANRYLPPVEQNQFSSHQPKLVLYTRMPRLSRLYADYYTAAHRAEWETQTQALLRSRVLLIDEAQIVYDNDRVAAGLLDLIDTRITECRPTFLAMNARWDELHTDAFPKLLQQLREKLTEVTREVVLAGNSRRTPWGEGAGEGI